MYKFGQYLMLVVALMLPSQAIAQERQPEGYILEKESYVFTVEEANSVKETIEKLEQLVLEYKALDEIQEKEILKHQELLKNERDIKGLYEERQALDLEYIGRLEKRAKFAGLERTLIFTGGVAVAVASILIADKIVSDMGDVQYVPAQRNRAGFRVNVKF